MKRTLWVLLSATVLAAFSARGDTVEIQNLITTDDTALNWMSFTCDRGRTTMVCTTFQTVMNTKVKPDEVDQEIEKRMVEAEARPQGGFDAKECVEIDALAKNVLSIRPGTGGITRTPDGKPINAKAIAHTREMMMAMQAACQTNTLTNRRRVIELTVRSESRMCKAFSFWGKQTFNLDINTGNWVSTQGPVGPCGIINVNTLVNDLTVLPNKQSNDLFWIYTSKRIVTSPSGTIYGMQSCASLAQHTFRYDWRKRDTPLQCDTIGYGL